MTDDRRESPFVQPVAGQIVQTPTAHLPAQSKVKSATRQTEEKIRYMPCIKSIPCAGWRPSPAAVAQPAVEDNRPHLKPTGV